MMFFPGSVPGFLFPMSKWLEGSFIILIVVSFLYLLQCLVSSLRMIHFYHENPWLLCSEYLLPNSIFGYVISWVCLLLVLDCTLFAGTCAIILLFYNTQLVCARIMSVFIHAGAMFCNIISYKKIGDLLDNVVVTWIHTEYLP